MKTKSNSNKYGSGIVSTPNGVYTDSKGTKWKPGKKYNPKG